MTACCQNTCAIPRLPCEQLPYPLEYPRISRMRQRDKSDLPLPDLSYKYFLLRYSFISSFYSPKIYFPGSGATRGLQELQQRPFFTNPQVFDLLPYEEMAINFVVPEVSLPPFLLHFYCTPVHPQFVLLNTPFFFLFFFLSLKTSRIWPIKSLFLPINLTSNVLAR